MTYTVVMAPGQEGKPIRVFTEDIAERCQRILDNMPVQAEAAHRILKLDDKQGSFTWQALDRIISCDAGLSSRVLKLANSPLFARPQTIASVETAASLLGLKEIKNLALMVAASSLYHGGSTESILVRDLWSIALVRALMTLELGAVFGLSNLQEEAWPASLFQDVGKLALVIQAPMEWKIMQTSIAVADWTEAEEIQGETRIFGIDHRDIGARAMQRWGFPPEMVDVARFHGNLYSASRHRRLIFLCTIADILARAYRTLPPSVEHAVLDDAIIEILLPYLPQLSIIPSRLPIAWPRIVALTRERQRHWEACL